MTTTKIASEEVRGVDTELHYDQQEQRYVLTIYPGGYEVEMPFVAVDLSMADRIHLLRRRQMGLHASGDTLEGSPSEWGSVGQELERIAGGEHAEVATHA